LRKILNIFGSGYNSEAGGGDDFSAQVIKKSVLFGSGLPFIAVNPTERWHECGKKQQTQPKQRHDAQADVAMLKAAVPKTAVPKGAVPKVAVPKVALHDVPLALSSLPHLL